MAGLLGAEVLAAGVPATGGANSAAGAAATPPLDPEATFVQECGACHMAYPAGFLPTRSWQALIDHLDDHFGENASLDADTTKIIADYLLANAADAGGGSSYAMMGLSDADVPLRITDTPYWQRLPREVSSGYFARPNVKTKSNCLACHAGGGQGGEDN